LQRKKKKYKQRLSVEGKSAVKCCAVFFGAFNCFSPSLHTMTQAEEEKTKKIV
jgi:hypothetical protein